MVLQNIFRHFPFFGKLTGMEVLEKVYTLLKHRNQLKTISFRPYDERTGKGGTPRVLIADDSDDHRTRQGFMSYDTAMLVRFAGREYILSLGRKTGDYPGNRFAGDIIALSADDIMQVPLAQLEETVRYCIRTHVSGSEHPPFSESLLVAMSDGFLSYPSFAKKGRSLHAQAGEALKSHVSSPLQQDERYLSLDSFSPVCTKPMFYKGSAVRVLAEGIEAVLRE